jgi:hypothetical protein
MSVLEDRLRDAYRAAAETVRPLAAEDPRDTPGPRVRARGGPRRRRVLIPLAAAAAVIAVVAGLVLVSGPASTPQAQPARPGPLPPGAPRFYLDVPAVGPLRVYDTATGKVVGSRQPPGAGAQFAGQVAAINARTFLTAVSAPGRGSCHTRLYEFRLNGRGQPGPLTPLPVTLPGYFSGPNGLSVTPDGRLAAYAVLLGRCTISSVARSEQVGVANLVTGRSRTWTVPKQGPLLSSSTVSLSADGRRVAVTQPLANPRNTSASTARMLSTSAPEGHLDQRATVDSAPATVWAALSPDGRSLYTCQQILSATTGLGGITYATRSVTSQRQRVIARWSRRAAPVCAAGLDSSGRYLLIEVPDTRPINAGHLVVVDLNTGRYTNLWPPGFVTSDIPGGGTVAW